MTVIDDNWAGLLKAARHPGGDRADVVEAIRLAVDLGCVIDPESVGCSVTMVDGDGYVTPAASSPQALGLDEVQYAHNGGPCVAAARSGAWHDIEVIRVERRWPSFVATAIVHGVSSSLSIPLSVPGEARQSAVTGPAALNLYSAGERAFVDERRRNVAGFLARCLSAALSATADRAAASLASPGLQESTIRGRLVTRAVEIVSAGREVDGPVAYRILADRSKMQGRAIAAVAADGLAAPTARRSERASEAAGPSEWAGETAGGSERASETAGGSERASETTGRSEQAGESWA